MLLGFRFPVGITGCFSFFYVTFSPKPINHFVLLIDVGGTPERVFLLNARVMNFAFVGERKYTGCFSDFAKSCCHQIV